MLSERSKPILLVAITLAAMLLLLAAAEGAVRLRQMLKYGSAATLEEHYTYDAKLNLRIPVAGFSSGRITINKLGFRGPEILVAKPPGTVRVAYLGASTTWCAEVSSNEHVWPHLATDALQKAFPGAAFDYVNAGVPGYTIASIHRNFEHRVAPLEPDVIVIYEAANNLTGEMREIAVRRGIIKDEKIELTSWPSRHSLLWYLVEKNLRVQSAQRQAAAGQGTLTVDPATLGEDYRKHLTALVVAARKQARLVALSTFSIQPRRAHSAAEQLRASASALFYMPFVTPAMILDAYERQNQIITEVAKETGALLIEGEHDIPGDAIHFTDSVHFSDAGSRLMALRVAGALAASATLRGIVAARAASG